MTLCDIAEDSEQWRELVARLLLKAVKKGKVGRATPERRRGAHLPVKAIEPVGG